MLAYSNGFVAVCLANNRPVREINKDSKRVAIIPFDTEYKIRITNKKTVRCKVEVFVDGTDVLFGQKIVLGAGQSMDLERFLTDNNSGNKFKFISKQKAMATGEIMDPDSEDNGRIQVKFYEEQPWNCFTTILTNHQPGFYGGTVNCASNGTANVGVSNSGCTTNSIATSNTTLTSTAASVKSSAGVTAEGNVSHQKFSAVADFQTYQYSTDIDIWLSGPLVDVQDAPLRELAKKSIELGLRPNATAEQRALALEYIKHI